jgi:DNA-binding GntR family transcriptional regulator
MTAAVGGAMPAADTPGEAAYRTLRADMVLGRLLPGRKLRLEGLRESYRVGVSTLREALTRLASEGLVVAEGQRGFSVAPVSPADFAEVADLRLLLERRAIRESFAAGDLDWEGRVVGAGHKLAVLEHRLLAGEAAEPALWKRYDVEFHQALIEACGSAVLIETYAAVYDRYMRHQMVALAFPGAFPGDIAAGQHAALRASALSRDAEGACRILDAHVAGCVADVTRTGALLPFAARRTGHDASGGDTAETAGERVYRLIRTDILRNRLTPGQKLKLDALRDAYGAGIGTLRETLGRLVAERLVVAEGQRGFEVARFSAAELHELASLRLLLESHALDQALRSGDVEWEARVVAAHHKLAQMEERLGAGDAAALDSWRMFDSEFHRTLVSACGSRTLMATHAAIFDRYQRYQNKALGFRGAIAVAEHAAMRDAALRRDAAAAREVLATHILGGVDHALASGAL